MPKTASAATLKNTYDLPIGDITLSGYNSSNADAKIFDGNKLALLYSALSNGGSTLKDVEDYISSSTNSTSYGTQKPVTLPKYRTATDIFNDNGSRNVTLNLGNQEWAVSFLTTDINGDVIATLWMTQPLKNTANSIITGKAGWATSNYATSYSATDGELYISNQYSTSNLRMTLLNAGATDGSATKYATSSSNANVSSLTGTVAAETRKASTLAPFTLDNSALAGTAFANKSLINYITAPKDVYYTYYLDWAYSNKDMISVRSTYNSYALNDALSKDASGNFTLSTVTGGTDTKFYSNVKNNSGTGSDVGAWWNAAIYNYANSDAHHYNDWGADYVWAPSVTEIGYSKSTTEYTLGLWGTGGSVTGQLKFGNESTTNSAETVESSTGRVWTRSGNTTNAYRYMYIAENGSITNNFPASSYAVRPALHLNLTKAQAASVISAPQNISGLTYDGTGKWLDNLSSTTFTWLNADIYDNEDYMTPSITYTDANGTNQGTVSKGDVKNAGTYTVTMTPASGIRWSDGDGTGTRSFTITVGQATPIVDPTFPATRPFVTSGFPEPTSYTAKSNGADITGKFEWINQTELIEANKSKDYEWTFKPDDGVNYKTVTGKATFNFQERTVVSRTYSFKNDVTKLYTATSNAELMNKIKLEVVYSDSATPVVETNFEILGATLVAGNGGSSVTVKFGNSIETINVPASIEVIQAAIERLTVIFVQGGKVITVETPLDELKNCVTVYAKWNYTDDQQEIAKADYKISGTLSVSGSNITVEYDGTTSDPVANINVTKATYNMSAAQAAASATQEQVYNKNAQSFTFDASNLPKGVTVNTITYTDAGGSTGTTAPTNAGEYTVTVSFSQENTADYNAVADITSKLTIKKADYPEADKIKFTGAQVYADGNPHSLAATGVPGGVSVTYSCPDHNGGAPQSAPIEFTADKKYSVTAHFTFDNAADNDNYKAIADITAELEITDLLMFDMSGATISGTGNATVDGATATATYDGNGVEISISSLPANVGVDGVAYERKQADGTYAPVTGTPTDAGEYRVVISFTNSDPAYATPQDIELVLTIDQAEIDMSGADITPPAGGGLTAAGSGFAATYNPDKAIEIGLSDITAPAGAQATGVTYKKLKAGGDPTVEADWNTVTEIKEAGEYKVVVEFEPTDKDNYKPIAPVNFTVTVGDAVITGITATLAEDASFNTESTLDDVKAKLTVKAVFNNGVNNAVTEFTLNCATVRDGGLLEVGQQTVKVTYNDGTADYDYDITITVSKAKAALPVYKSTLSYTGGEFKPSAADFEYDADLIDFIAEKTVAGTNAGSYKAVFALKDGVKDRYEWASAGASAAVYVHTATLKAVPAADSLQLDAGEVAVEWNIAKAKISAKKADGALPVFSSESYSGSFAPIVALKYYADATCTEEVAASSLKANSNYFVKAELLDNANFEFDSSAAALAVSPFEYLTPAGPLSIWQKIINFVKANWLYFAIGAAALVLLILLICVVKHRNKTKEERLAKKEAKEEEKRRREEERQRKEEERELQRAKQEAELAKIKAQAGMGAGMGAMAMAQPQMQQQMPMQQYPQMPSPAQAQPQMQQQPYPQMQQGFDGGFMARIEAELAAIRSEQKTKTEAELANAKMLVEFERLRGDMKPYGMPRQDGYPNGGQKNTSIPADVVIALIEAVRGGNAAPAYTAAPAPAALPQSVEESKPVSVAYPPDAVVTTTTTVDTTKNKQLSPRSDDGRMFDIDGFYDTFEEK